jgi:hypothetical protein
MHRTAKEEALKDAMFLKTIERSMQELYAAIASHRSVMTSIYGQEKIGAQTETVPWAHCSPESRERVLKEAIREAIDVLEESRKAFKSKRLEVLRKKLTNVLIDTDQ